MARSREELWRQAAIACNLVVVLLVWQQKLIRAEIRLDPTIWLYPLDFNVCSAATFSLTLPSLPYAKNLKQLKSALVSSASSALYNISSAGSGAARVYGTYQCRGDLNSTECYACVSNAAAKSSFICPQSVNAHIELEACSFLYQNFTIAPNFSFLDILLGPVTNSSAAFVQSRLPLLQYVSNDASTDPHFYSSASNSAAVYAIAQCHGYLTPDECSQCLRGAGDPQSLHAFSSGNESRGRIFFGSCMERFDDVIFFNPIPTPISSTPISPFIPPASDAVPSPKTIIFGKGHPGQNRKRLMFIALALACFLIVLVSCCGFLLYRKRASNTCKEAQEYIELQETMQQHQIRFFSPQQLKEATKNFHSCNKLGNGGSGSVYKGRLQDGLVIAVKKITHPNHHGKLQFLTEVKTITGIQHRNLIRLIGCSLDATDKYLIYEFLPNKSLDKHIFCTDRGRASALPWITRQNIIQGIAKGLMYLHHESNTRIIHRDIKAANVLLDENMEPKIADFGLARFLSVDQTHLNTAIAGTIGYLAPEYIMHGQLTEKSDTYGFGLLVLEILSGRRVNDASFLQEHQGLLMWAWTVYEEGRLADLMDPLIEGEYTEEQVHQLVQIALLCTQTVAALRPTMRKVVALLEGEEGTMSNPTKLEFALQAHSGLSNLITSQVNISANQLSGLTLPR